jgi:hypothetical protein
MEEVKKSKKWLDILLLIFKILLPLVVIFFMTYMTVELIDVVKTDAANKGQSGYFAGHGFMLLAIILVMGAVDIAVLIAAGVFLTVSMLYRSAKNRRANIVTFALLCAMSPVSFGLMFVINAIVSAIFGG